MERILDLEKLLFKFKNNGFNVLHKVQQDNNIINLKCNNSNIKHIQIDV